MRKEGKRRCINEGECSNTTKYGEFVCTTHQWLPLDKQKKDAEDFEKITKKQRKTTNT